MSEEIKEEAKEEAKEQPKIPEKKVFADHIGRYTMVDGSRVYQLIFPIASTIEENFAAISFMRDEVLKAVELKVAQEKEAAEKKAEAEKEVPEKEAEEVPESENIDKKFKK